ncbi:serine/threonine protein kinase [Streptomyces chrestomyceticus JCM 4735]|uniref:Serine/threonine protein kinase n=1 Tax=Streptomyces chrestomyceticus JCM 4735 TaxID=1306181 RepID=A0A7U9KXT3_9ACTN|nr:serine/threonine-protein kinase [Streptomyces chrestomyceticus]GCD36573.1 serine/threonine protein kinase [Streptomyces chrestomyceticus JCM 4735]
MNERAERGRLGQLGPQDPPRIGAYRLLGRLGEGGMGRVYLARSDRGRTVAVKLVKTELSGQDDFRARFRQEVQAARRVGGEWTAPVLDADTEAATPWVATGYIAGPSLRQVITEGRTPLPERSVRILAGGLAGALRSIHAAGIVHRDLKPSNILLTIDGPKVIDFGIARALEAVTVGGGLTRTNQAVGSPGFMSPEQVRGRPVTPASDVFCLGSVLMFAATGRLPFGTSDSGVHALMYRIAQEDPDLTGLPYGLHSLVAACLAKDPAQRPTPEQLIAYTASEDDGQEPWLPGALIAELGRHAVELLDAENPNGAWEESGDASWDNPADPSWDKSGNRSWDGSGGHRSWESADGSWNHSGAVRGREQTPAPAPGPVSAPLPPQVPGTATPPPYAAAGAPTSGPAASDATVTPSPGATTHGRRRKGSTGRTGLGSSPSHTSHSGGSGHGGHSSRSGDTGRSRITGTPRSTGRPRTRTLGLAAAVGIGLATAGIGIAYVWFSPDGDDGSAAKADGGTVTAADGKVGKAAGKEPGVIPQKFLGTWETKRGKGGSDTYRFTLTQGAVGDTVLAMEASGAKFRCEFKAILMNGGPPVRLGPTTVVAGPATTCSPGAPSTLRLQPDGKLRRVFDDGKPTFTYTKKD